MQIKIGKVNINYIQYGSGKENIVLLHGWGQNIEMMMPLGDRLQKKYKNVPFVTLADFW